MVYHLGKPMAQTVADSGQAFSSVFNSSMPQRPVERGALRSFGGRPLGPNSYNPTPPEWSCEPERQSSAFASKTQKAGIDKVLTSDIDYLNKPELIPKYVEENAPGTLAYSFPRHEQETQIVRGGDGLLDRFYDVEYGPKLSLHNGVHQSGRKYAASFTSASKRFPLRREQHDLGPGSYEMPSSAVQVRDSKRPHAAFKSLTTGSCFSREANEAPDAIQTNQYAEISKVWTSKGLAFSTRERFPRQRPKWKD